MGTFRVEANNSDIALDWLNVNQQIDELPLSKGGDNTPFLQLGHCELNRGSLINQLGTQIAYFEGGYYRICTAIYPRLKAPLPDDTLPERSPSPAVELNGGLSFLFGPSTSPRRSLPVSMEQLLTTIKDENTMPGCGVELTPDERELEITREERGAYGLDSGKYRLTEVTDNPMTAPIYLFENEREKIPDNPEEFAHHYDFHARLLEKIVTSLCLAADEEIPNAVFNLEPEDNALLQIKKLKQGLVMAKKQLNAAGFDDIDDSEITKNIILERPNISFQEVGGQEKAKTELNDVIAGLEDPEEFYSEGATPPTGVMLYGPSGTGKTILAKATAGVANAAFYNVELSSILHSLWGKTERYIQKIFDMARENAPAIIFLDEIDAIARQRNSLNSAYSSIVNVLLVNMDGMRERSNGVVVIAATNLLDLVDDSLLRPGRFDMLIPVDMPDEAAREQIFNIHKRAALMRAGRPEGSIIDANFDIQKFVADSKGYSGADIEELLRRGLVERVRQKRRGITPLPLNANDLEEQIKAYERVRKDKMIRKETMGFRKQ